MKTEGIEEEGGGRVMETRLAESDVRAEKKNTHTKGVGNRPLTCREVTSK